MDTPTFYRIPSGSRKRRRTPDPTPTSVRASSNLLGDSPSQHPTTTSGPQDHPNSKVGGEHGEGEEIRVGETDGVDSADPYGDEDWEEVVLPNDTMAAILALQREFYGASAAGGSTTNNAKGGRSRERTGIVLQHQIYTILDNRTAVDLELRTMLNDNSLRRFHLNTGREDWGIMSTQHYLKLISNVLGNTASAGHVSGTRHGAGTAGSSVPTLGPKSSKGEETIELERATDVLRSLVQSSTKAYVSRKDIARAIKEIRKSSRGTTELGIVDRSFKDAEASITGGKRPQQREKGRVKSVDTAGENGSKDGGLPDLRTMKEGEAGVLSVASRLIRAGFLIPRRDVGQEDAYWFSMPQLGKMIVAISSGRKELMKMIKRTKYKEVRRKALEAKNPVKSGLPLSFHIRDVVGHGLLRELDTPAGVFLRLSRDA